MDDHDTINNKYLKYKKKYIDLKNKNQLGGNDDKPKVSKKESGYVKAYPQIRCGTCKFFHKGDEIVDVEEVKGLQKVSGHLGKCELVNGEIHEYGCCNLWTIPGKSPHFDFSAGEEIKKSLFK